MFDDQPTGWPGRRPKGYLLTKLMSVEELVQEIERLTKVATQTAGH